MAFMGSIYGKVYSGLKGTVKELEATIIDGVPV